MQSVVLYGRLLARALVTGINSEYHLHRKTASKDLCLVSAASGFGKSFSPAQITKKWRFGDDACFTASHKLGDVIGVADGVGGWRAYGIDPSQFPASLMLTCERMVREGRFRPHSPVEIIAASYYELIENKAPLLGSCTACVVSLQREEKKMYAANLGDSGYLVVREGKVVCRSQEQQHYFNTPFQLSITPPDQEGLMISDSPESAGRTSFGVEEGDIILVGTDGLFDNMHEEMILEQLQKLKDRKAESIQRIANSIAHLAHQLAFDPDYMSPFALSASEHGFVITGGKPDDVTVVLASVERAESI